MRLTSDQLQAVRTTLQAETLAWLADADLIDKPIDAMTRGEWAELHEAAASALSNAGPIVRSYLARQGQAAYPVWIAGIEGVFLLIAAGHETLGPFTTLADAVDGMEANHGEFLTAG